MVAERLIGLIEVISWLNLCFKKFYLDLLKYFHGVENRLWEYSLVSDNMDEKVHPLLACCENVMEQD